MGDEEEKRSFGSKKSKSLRLPRGEPHIFCGSKSFRSQRSDSITSSIFCGFGSFRLQGSRGRSSSSRLVSESGYEAAVRYEGLKSDEPSPKGRKAAIMRILSRVLHGVDSRPRERETEPKPKEERRRSSWLPDPQRRWPVQGW